jgi:hypothetical protein
MQNNKPIFILIKSWFKGKSLLKSNTQYEKNKVVKSLSKKIIFHEELMIIIVSLADFFYKNKLI